MELKETNPWAILLMFLACVLTAWLVSQAAYIVILTVVGAITVLLLTMLNLKFTLIILVFSMLLSPEIGLSTGNKEIGQEAGRAVTIRIDDILLALICIVWMIKGAVQEDVGFIHYSPINKYIFAYLAISFFATTFGILDGIVTLKSGFFFFLKYCEYFVLYFIVYGLVQNVQDDKFVRQLLRALFITCFIVAIYAMSQLGTGKRVSAPFEGDIGEPNTLGMYLLIVGSIAFGLIQNGISGYDKTKLWALIFFITIPFLATLSRSSYTAFAGIMITYMVWSKHKHWLILAFMLAMFIVPTALPQNVKDRIMFTFMQKKSKSHVQYKVGGVSLDTSTSARIDSWMEVGEGLAKRPFLGYGITGFSFVDGQYIKVLIETGLIGFIVFMTLIYQIFWITLKTYKEAVDPYYKGISMGFFCALVGMLVHGITSNTFILIRIMEPFCMLMGIVFNLKHLEEVSKEKEIHL